MRADRLLSILILLQARGRMTAQALAGELEVSERTIYRDMEALGMAGVPVFAERGPGGGCALLDSYRTNLTGLSEGELRALFTLSLPSPLEDLGMSQEFKSALVKLSAALPASRRKEEERVRERIHLDWQAWQPARQPVPFLTVVQQAIWTNRMLRIRFRRHFGMEVEKDVHPLGLVAKAGEWYLVCMRSDLVKVHTVRSLVSAQVCAESSQRPPGFNLEAYWTDYCRQWENNRPSLPVTVRVQTDAVAEVERVIGQKLNSSRLCEDGRCEAVLVFESLDQARRRLLGCGRIVEVIDPLPLRLSLIDYAAQILKIYHTDLEGQPSV